MRDFSAVSGLKPELEAAGVNVLLLNIHDAPGSLLLERFGFRFSPTYLVYDGQGEQLWRATHLPKTSKIRTVLGI